MDLLVKCNEAENVDSNFKMKFCKPPPRFDSISEVQYGCTMTHVGVGRYIVLTSAGSVPYLSKRGLLKQATLNVELRRWAEVGRNTRQLSRSIPEVCGVSPACRAPNAGLQ
jgi:hypothetical protein